MSDLKNLYLSRFDDQPVNGRRIAEQLGFPADLSAENVIIYGLLDYNFEVRYVGKSQGNRVPGRLAFHVRTKNWVYGIYVLDRSDQENWANREKGWIAFYRMRSLGRGAPLLNIASGGEGGFCYGHTEETKKKMAKAHEGSEHSLASIIKISEGNKGKKRSAETKENIGRSSREPNRVEQTRQIGKANKGRKRSAESIKKQKATWEANHPDLVELRELRKPIYKPGEFHRGRRHSQASKDKISAANKGKSHPCTEEAKEKIRAAHKGVPKPPEQVAKSVATKRARRLERKASATNNPSS